MEKPALEGAGKHAAGESKMRVTAQTDGTVQEELAAGSLKKEQALVDCTIRRVLRQSYWPQIIELCNLWGVFPLICVSCNVFLSFFLSFFLCSFHHRNLSPPCLS